LRGALPHHDGKPAQIGVSHQPDLPARELQNSTFLVDEYNAADANAERKTRTGCAVDTGNIYIFLVLLVISLVMHFVRGTAL